MIPPFICNSLAARCVKRKDDRLVHFPIEFEGGASRERLACAFVAGALRGLGEFEGHRSGGGLEADGVAAAGFGAG